MKKGSRVGPAAATVPGYRVIRVSSWRQYRDLVEGPEFRSWAFRGHADARWPLFSSLSRHLKYAGVHHEAWRVQEERILRIFRRKSHLFLQHIPPERDSFEWLALMQHHGAPTRLLDATWSPYVALFFALERGARVAAVWAFNAAVLNEREFHMLRDGRRVDLREVGIWEYGSYETHFLHARIPFVIIGEPKAMNRRLIAQSGTFVAPSMLDVPVEDVIDSYANSEELLVKIELHVRTVREESMRSLYTMNITHATLFPDLDGLARSMAYELEYHWAFDPRTMVPNPGFPPPSELSIREEDERSRRPKSRRPSSKKRGARAGARARRSNRAP